MNPLRRYEAWRVPGLRAFLTVALVGCGPLVDLGQDTDASSQSDGEGATGTVSAGTSDGSGTTVARHTTSSDETSGGRSESSGGCEGDACAVEGEILWSASMQVADVEVHPTGLPLVAYPVSSLDPTPPLDSVEVVSLSPVDGALDGVVRWQTLPFVFPADVEQTEVSAIRLETTLDGAHYVWSNYAYQVNGRWDGQSHFDRWDGSITWVNGPGGLSELVAVSLQGPSPGNVSAELLILTSGAGAGGELILAVVDFGIWLIPDGSFCNPTAGFARPEGGLVGVCGDQLVDYTFHSPAAPSVLGPAIGGGTTVGGGFHGDALILAGQDAAGPLWLRRFDGAGAPTQRVWPSDGTAVEVYAAETDPLGNTAVATSSGITKFSPGFDLLWTTPVIASHLATGPEGEVLVASDDTVYLIAP